MDLFELFQDQLDPKMISQLSQQLGGADEQQTAMAANGIMSTLVTAMSKNASTPEGANALASALDRDHDGSVLDDLMGMLQGNTTAPTANERAMNGTGILNHILGDRQGGVVDMISKMSGLDQGKTGNLMTMLAPVLMGMLGKTKRQNGLDSGGISSLLNQTVSNGQSKNPTMGLITQFLDQDGDGSIVDDALNIGMKFLGGFLRGNK